MNKGKLNHWIGLALLLTIICFFFDKSVFSHSSLNTTLSTVEKIQDLQVQLHRDLLRYRNNQIQGYDNLNETLIALNKNINDLSVVGATSIKVIRDPVTTLKHIIENESLLVEDFKTHHSILQNSLFYIFNRSTRLYSETPGSVSKDKQQVTAELITLLLEYNESPKNNIANKIYNGNKSILITTLRRFDSFAYEFLTGIIKGNAFNFCTTKINSNSHFVYLSNS